MNSRKLVTKPAIKAARAAMESQGVDVKLTDEQLHIILFGGAREIASKAVFDFADYFSETASVIGVDPTLRKSMWGITRRFALAIYEGQWGRK